MLRNDLKRGLKIALFYLGLLIANYGMYIPWWGLYGDDWQYLYSYHLLGAGGYPAFVAPDRPFSAWVYMLFTPVLGETTWAYHVLLLLLRWAAGLLLWKTLKTLWPRQEELAFWAGTILVIYPGFRQQPLPLEFILHFSVLNLTLLSLFCMLRAAESKSDHWKWTIPGLLSALGIFSVEYFTGLELLRPVLLWVKIRKSSTSVREKVRMVMLQWLPYLAVFLAFLYWRVFIFQFQHYKPSAEGISNPLKFLVHTVWAALESMWLALVASWNIQIELNSGLPAAFAQLAALIASFILLYWVLKRVSPQNTAEDTETGWEAYWFTGVGASALALAGPLYWALDIPIQGAFPWDRPLLSFIPGVAILLGTASVRMLVPRYRSRILAGLCAIALIANFHNASSYMKEWQGVRSYLNQLTQRIPQVEAGTMLMTQNLPFEYYGENTFFPILNWLYQPENHTPQMRLRMFDLSIRQGEAVGQLERGEVLSQNYRSFQFQSDREQIIAFTYQPPACLHILYPDEQDYPHLPDWLRDLVHLSKPERIQRDAEKAPALPTILGGPVSPSWCTYYQDAERERQRQDWEQVRAIADLTESQGLKPAVGYEYLPFIEAFARAGDWDRAVTYFRLAKTEDQAGNAYVCSRWEKIAASLKQEAADDLTGLYCTE